MFTAASAKQVARSRATCVGERAASRLMTSASRRLPGRAPAARDCGLKTRGRPETRVALESLFAAAREIRAELPTEAV